MSSGVEEERLAKSLAAFAAGMEVGFLRGSDMAAFYATVSAEDDAL